LRPAACGPGAVTGFFAHNAGGGRARSIITERSRHPPRNTCSGAISRIFSRASERLGCRRVDWAGACHESFGTRRTGWTAEKPGRTPCPNHWGTRLSGWRSWPIHYSPSPPRPSEKRRVGARHRRRVLPRTEKPVIGPGEDEPPSTRRRRST
jgi:hypothetical protein